MPELTGRWCLMNTRTLDISSVVVDLLLVAGSFTISFDIQVRTSYIDFG